MRFNFRRFNFSFPMLLGVVLSFESFATQHCHHDAGRILKTGDIFVSPPPNEVTKLEDLFPSGFDFKSLPSPRSHYETAFVVIQENTSKSRREELLALLKESGPVAVYTALAKAFERSDYDSKFTAAMNTQGIRAAFHRLVRKELKFKYPEISLVLTDIRFLNILNKFGYTEADDIMGEWVRLTEKSLRSWDAIGRFGGDEFVVILNSASTNVNMSILPRLHRHREYIIEKYLPALLAKYDTDFEFQRTLNEAIPAGPITRKDLSEMGVLQAGSLGDDVFGKDRIFTTREKLEYGFVVPGSVTSGVAKVDISKLDPVSATDQEIDSVFQEAMKKAQVEFNSRRSLEAQHLGLNSRPKNL